LPVAKKLVYSPHEYGAGVYNQPWFSDPTFPNNMPARWEMGFNYIATQGIAPILVGEFGGRQVDSSSKEGIWQQKFVDFIAQKISASPIGVGIQIVMIQVVFCKMIGAQLMRQSNNCSINYYLLLVWLQLLLRHQHQRQRQHQHQHQHQLPHCAPTPVHSSTDTCTSPAPTPAPAPTPTGTPQLKAEAVIQSDWDKGFCVNLNVTNQGTASTKNWQMTFQLNQATINNAWGANYLPQGQNYLVNRNLGHKLSSLSKLMWRDIVPTKLALITSLHKFQSPVPKFSRKFPRIAGELLPDTITR
jgi:endoglucanase